MPTKRKPARETGRIEGLVLPRDDASLRELWKAFPRGTTWLRIGRRSRLVTRFRHKQYKGRVTLTWWGKALRFSVEEADSSGRIAGAFLGHVQRHGRPAVARIEFQFH